MLHISLWNDIVWLLYYLTEGDPIIDLDVLTLKCVTWCESVIGCHKCSVWLCPPRALGMVCYSFYKANNSSCIYRRWFLWRTLRSRMSQRCSVGDIIADFAGHGKTWMLFCCRKSRQTRAVCDLALPCWKIPPVTVISGTTWCCSISSW